ncbi:MAG: HIT domain-containing protein [Burkholderiales bacterium]|nr:HIT domain-containing protein [Phycisphaerae bacterium]
MSTTLHAPWRMDYIRSLENADQSQGGCFLCQAIASLAVPEQRRARLVLWDTPHSVVVMNKFPYTNGHVLVAPRSHVGAIEDLAVDQLTDLQSQTVAVVKLLKKVMAPQGFNIGINQGRCAGAGLPGHLHQHIVPRWGGDVNFMSVVGNIRVQPQAMELLYAELVRV